MKKSVFFLSIILFILVAWSVAGLESEYFYKTIFITKIYPHALGYKVVYMKSSMDLAETYLPLKWFSASSGKDGQLAKGEIIWGDDSTYPYMAIYWKENKFSHVRLYVKKNFQDISWGTMSSEAETKNFEVDEPKLEF